MLKNKIVCSVALAAMMIVPALAADEAKNAKRKGKGKEARQNFVTMQVLKTLKPAELTDEQTKKIREMGKVVSAKVLEMREAAGITPELNKKRAEAQKSMKESGKKGKELASAVNEAAGFTEAQSDAVKSMNETRMAFQKKVIAMLSDEQKAKLPKRLTSEGRGKGKKKKDAA